MDKIRLSIGRYPRQIFNIPGNGSLAFDREGYGYIPNKNKIFMKFMSLHYWQNSTLKDKGSAKRFYILGDLLRLG